MYLAVNLLSHLSSMGFNLQYEEEKPMKRVRTAVTGETEGEPLDIGLVITLLSVS